MTPVLDYFSSPKICYFLSTISQLHHYLHKVLKLPTIHYGKKKTPASSVCSESHGGAILTSIFRPLYVTAGPTNLIFPARTCYILLLQPRPQRCIKIHLHQPQQSLSLQWPRTSGTLYHKGLDSRVELRSSLEGV